MAESKRAIPMPLRVRLMVLRRRVLPGVIFVGCLAATLFLWQRQQIRPSLRGQVVANQVQVNATADGMLTALPNQPNVFDPVVANATVVAQLDVSPLLAEIEVLRAQRAQLRAQLDAEESRLRMEQQGFALDRQRNRADWRRQLAQLRQEVLDLKVQRNRLALAQIDHLSRQAVAAHEKKRLEDRISHTRVLVEKSMASDFALQDLLNQLAVQETVIEESKTALAAVGEQLEDAAANLGQAESRLEEASEQRGDFAEDNGLADQSGLERAVEDVEALLRPIERAVEVQELRIHELVQRMASLEIRAPVSGAVTAVYQQPGTWVRMGDPIMAITQSRAEHVVAYLPSGDRRSVQPNMSVEVVVGAGRGERFEAKVEQVGAHFEPIPAHQLERSTVPEWGVPVQIILPADVRLRPGEFVEIELPPAGDAA